MCIWLLRHLKAAGILPNDLIKIYFAIIRSSIEYAVPAYGSLLTVTQSHELEKLQKCALKTIFGWKELYENLLLNAGLITLQERGKEILTKFARKTAANERFSEWFPKRDAALVKSEDTKYTKKK